MTFTVSAQTKGWVGIGFSNEPRMVPSDVVVGWVHSDSSVTVVDRYANAYDMPKPDVDLGGSNDIFGIEFSLKFQRKNHWRIGFEITW